MSEVLIVTGDLLEQRVDAIVNAWNRNVIPWWLLLPQGVSGAIKRRGGYQPFRELSRHGILRPGQAVSTSAGKLPFKAIIHVAALNLAWRSSPSIIRSAIRNALAVASDSQFSSVAIPLIGAGTGGVPQALAQQIIAEEARQSSFSGQVIIVVFPSSA
jgi:O-acetyl-ADP-ribose deacetylase